MGNRANIVVKGWNDNEFIYLYTHWEGSETPKNLRDALALNERWDDSAYLTRIIFQTMLGDDRGTTGYGISASMGDNGNPLLVVVPNEQAVYVNSSVSDLLGGDKISMQDFSTLTDEECKWNSLLERTKTFKV